MKVSSVVGMKCVLLFLLFLGVVVVVVESSSKKDGGMNGNAMKAANKSLQFASPLQTLTLFPKSTDNIHIHQSNDDDDDDLESVSSSSSSSMSPRKAFLPKFMAGLSAERRMKEKISSQRKELLLASLDDNDNDNGKEEGEEEEESGYSNNDWDKRSEAADRQRLKMEGLRMERAYDRAVAKYQQQQQINKQPPSTTTTTTNNNNNSSSPYQFVGVIHTNSNQKEVQWFARKKKNPDTWNVRLVHVNKDALLRDLFVRGKVDIYAEYKNTGTFITENNKNNNDDDNDDNQEQSQPQPQFGRPLLQTKYSVKKRSWRNLWNFSPKHMFTDSSGSFWRERRLSPGLYTDGNYVYESTYRYSDGKNGMKPLSTLDAFMKSKSIASPVKQTIIKKLKQDSPDVVIEE